MDVNVGLSTQITVKDGQDFQWVNIGRVDDLYGITLDVSGWTYQVIVLQKEHKIKLVTLPPGRTWYDDFINSDTADGWKVIHHQPAAGKSE